MGFLDWFRKKDPKDAFADRLRREILRSGEDRPIRYDKERFSLEVGEGHVIYLQNIYEEYCAAPPAVQTDVFRRYVLLKDDVPLAKTLDEALPHLIPRVRERFFFTSLLLTFEAEGRKLPRFAFKTFADHFAIELAYDLPQQSVHVMQDTLDEWKTALEEALKLAQGNLQAMTTVPLKVIRPGLYVSPWNDTYAPSRLLLPEYITSHQVKGEPVVAVANRDLLLLTGSQDPEGLEEMARRVHQAREKPRFMTGHVLVWSEGAWSLFTPEPDQSSFTDFLMLRQLSAAGAYEHQKVRLDEIHEKKNIDVYVASVSLLQNKETNQIRSYCVWTQGVDTLLPETDDVVFHPAEASDAPNEKSRYISVPWAAVRNRLGALMSPVDGYPVRYRVTEFPSPEILREIAREP